MKLISSSPDSESSYSVSAIARQAQAENNETINLLTKISYYRFK